MLGGSPFDCVILDADMIKAKWDSARLCPGSRPVQIELESKGALHGKIVAKVTGTVLLNGDVFKACNVNFKWVDTDILSTFILSLILTLYSVKSDNYFSF